MGDENIKLKHSFVLTGFAFMLSTSMLDHQAHAAENEIANHANSNTELNHTDSVNSSSNDDTLKPQTI